MENRLDRPEALLFCVSKPAARKIEVLQAGTFASRYLCGQIAEAPTCSAAFFDAGFEAQKSRALRPVKPTLPENLGTPFLQMDVLK